jgi:hypothetical protein
MTMTTTTTSPLRRNSAAHTALAALAALILIAVLTGLNERLGVADTAAFWAMFLVGVLLCTGGPLGHGATFGWFNPLHVAGYALGVLLLLLGAAVLFDFTIPGIADAQAAVVALAAGMLVKGLLALLYRPKAA